VSLLGELSIVGAARPIPVPASLLREARRERTLPVVCRNLGRACPEERGILARQLLAGHQFGEIAGRLEVLPLKGYDLARRLYPSMSMRDMGDLDVLVRPGSLREADAELRRLGYAPAHEPGPARAALYEREGSMPVHLHAHVLNGSLPTFMARIDVGELWREADRDGLAPHHRFLTLSEHALKHSYHELVHLTDVELASRGLDWERTRETAGRWGLERAALLGLLLLRDLCGVRSPGLDAFRGVDPGWEGRLLLRAARRRRVHGLSALGYLSMTEGAAGKCRFLREAIAPADREGLRTTSAGRRLLRAAGGVLEALTSWGEARPR
jgi:hypothetical protein